MVEDGLAEGAAFWRERASQLQTALDTRLVIEQAKGVLRERLGLDLTSAFELLRSSARGNGQNIHLLAEEVLFSFETPAAIVKVLAAHPETFGSPTRLD
jgi:AmiR/NasT family two-component response regulator